MSFIKAGREAAKHIWLHWGKPSYVQPDDPLVPEFAEGALLEFERLQAEAPGIMQVMAEGAYKGAQQLNLDDYHGIMEVLQNADDLHATDVAVSLLETSGHKELLILHNGEPVSVHHVLAMTYAFISTKTEDPQQKGKFGVGLKTLGRIANRMEVHSNTYSFAIDNQRISKVEPCPPILGFYQPGTRSTLLRLSLLDAFDVDEFLDWFMSLDASILLFLDMVTSFRFIPLDAALEQIEHRLVKDANPTAFRVCDKHHQREISSFNCRDNATGESWQVFQSIFSVPNNVFRSHKHTGEITRVGIGLPYEPAQQKFYAGLPTYIRTSLPFSLDAQFDPDTSRERLLQNHWNKWLFSKVSELLKAVAIHLCKTTTDRAWALIPLSAEMDLEDVHLEEIVKDAFHSAMEGIGDNARLVIHGNKVQFHGISFEAKALEGLLDAGDYPLIAEGRIGLPAECRDQLGRWRNIFSEQQWGREISVEDAFHLFEHDEICQQKSPDWFVNMLSAAISASATEPVFLFPCLMLVSGIRIPAQHPANKTELLVRNNDLKALSHINLVHSLHPAYFRNSKTWQTLEEFFLAHTNYAPEAKPYDVLTVFVNRYISEPVKLSNKELLEIKSLYDNGAVTAPELGQKLGQSILVDAYQWRRGKKIRCDARLADCYLFHGIVQDRAGQWAVAAGKTPGLTWVASRYRRVFRSSKSKHLQMKDNSLRKALGPGRFLRALGAEIAPRLVRLSEKRSVPYPLPVLQQDAINKLQQKPTHLDGDSISPDLQAVVDNICSTRKKAERKERGIALFEAISYSWDRLYSNAVSCSSVYHHYRWKPAGKIPSSWIAGLIQQPWLMNLKNEPKAPKDLVIRTSATQAIYGDAPKLFAIGLGNEHSSTGFPAALKMETNPRASSIVEQIRRMRDGLDDFDSMRLCQLYLSLADIAQRLKPHFTSDTPFDDLTVANLRAYFSEGSRRKGLLYVNSDWVTPEKVFWGKNIFHGRRLFVPTSKKLEPLWRVLELRQPDFAECIKVLYDIAKRPLESADEAVLIDTYRLLNIFTGNIAKSGKRQLRELPLWCNGRWVKSRPVFIVKDDDIRKCLAQVMPIWTPPCSFASMPKLLESLKVKVIGPSDLRISGADSLAEIVGEGERLPFMRAVAALQEYFARNDEQLYKSIQVNWERLKQAPIFISEHLSVEVAIPGLEHIHSDIRAHIVTSPLTFYFKCHADIGEKNAGGRVVAECFSPETCREQVALAWVWAWQEAIKGGSQELALAEEQEEEVQDEIVEAVKKSKGRKSSYERGETKKNEAEPGKESVALPRKLKDFEQLTTANIIAITSNTAEGGYKPSTGRGLKKDAPLAPAASEPTSRLSSSCQGPITYTKEQLEEKALRCLHHVLRYGNLGELKDFRKFRGIGADAAIELKKFFEIKASGREMPDRVELTLNELDRAKLSSDSFYLVVVSGLEEGYETILHIYKNPLRTLIWSPSRSIVVSGLKSKQAVQVKLDVDSPPAKKT